VSRIALSLSSLFLVSILPLPLIVVIIYPSHAQPIDSPPPIPQSFSNSTYVNTTLGIQVRIPSDWVEEDFITESGWKGVNFTSLGSHSFFVVNVTDSLNDDNRTIPQVLDSLKKTSQNVTGENLTTFAGLPAYQITSWKQVTDPETGEGIRLNVTDLVTGGNNNKTYHIRYGVDTDEGEDFSALRNILASFEEGGDANTGSQTQLSEQLSSYFQEQSTAVPPPLPLQQSVIPQTTMQQPQQTIMNPPLTQIPVNPVPPPLTMPSTTVPNPVIPPQVPLQLPPQVPLQLPPQALQPIKIPPRILSSNSYVDSIGNMHIVGEVINESLQPTYLVMVTATFYDTTNRVIGTDFTFADPGTLQPGQRAPFDIVVSQGSIPIPLIASYTLAADYSDFAIFG
jgi:hypothetical protein